MKIITIIAIIFLLPISSDAQTIKYNTCKYLHQYEGEWKYVQGADTIKVYLRYHEYEWVFNDSTYYVNSELIGWHEYKQGGVIIQSNYQNRFMPLSDITRDSLYNTGKCSLGLGASICNSKKRKLGGHLVVYIYNSSPAIREMIYNVSMKANAAMNTMHCHLSGGANNKNAKYPKNLPEDFVIIKQL